jgi:hypothetical protein
MITHGGLQATTRQPGHTTKVTAHGEEVVSAHIQQLKAILEHGPSRQAPHGLCH